MNKPHSVTLIPWLRTNLGRGCFAPVTGSDMRALRASIDIISLYNYDGDESLIEAFGIVVRRMQSSTMELAYHGIAHVMDWHHREQIWAAAGLPHITVGRCACEPRPYNPPSAR